MIRSHGALDFMGLYRTGIFTEMVNKSTDLVSEKASTSIPVESLTETETVSIPVRPGSLPPGFCEVTTTDKGPRGVTLAHHDS